MMDDTHWTPERAEPIETNAVGSPRPRPARRPARGRARVGAAAESSNAPDALDQYIRSLRAPRVLDKEETFEIARRLEAARDEFLAETHAIPGTAVKLVERWLERRRRGHVTAALHGRYRDGSGRDWSPAIDRALSRVERLLGKRDALLLATRSPTGELDRLDARIASAVKASGVSFEVVIELYKELVVPPRGRGSRAESRRLGLDRAENRQRLGRAGAAIERLDEAKQLLVVHNLRLVIKQAKRFRGMGVPYLDLIQEGNLGLIRAVEKFDWTLGYRFSTYAVWWIEQALVRAVQNASRTVRVPTHLYDLQIRLGRAREHLRKRLARAPTWEELAAELGVRPEDVERVTAAMQPITSTQSVLPGTDDFTLEDVLPDEQDADPAEDIDRTQLAVRLGRKLEDLGPRERLIIEARFGLAGAEPLTLQEIGEQLGLSRERVRQIEARALERLREQAGADGLEQAL